jgi:hypothetical protein
MMAIQNDSVPRPPLKYPHERHELLTRLPQIAARRSAGELDAAVYAALYFMHWQIALHGPQFASRRQKRDSRPDAGRLLAALERQRGEELRATLLDSFGRYQYRGVIAAVPVALARWLTGAWPLTLCEAIPTPAEVLRMQVQGTRAVTVLGAYPRMCRPVLAKPNAFAFFLHDLEHAYKFFHDPELHAGQRAFFALLERALAQSTFAPYWADATFVEKFHYLMSDMNTHPNHSRLYLRAILVEGQLRREGRGAAEALSPAGERAVEQAMRTVEEAAALSACA